ncbi:MAG TPA: glycosyltransferase family A protein [Vicinamibacterales bacterium]
MNVHRSPRFSIVLPTHDRADVLPYAIRSALCQTVDDFELLIVGDGCTDKTAEVVASFHDPRVRWFDLPKAPGIGYANRNVALREAQGQYVAYLAHDDLWFPDHLERLGALLDSTGAEFAYSRGLGVGIDGRIRPYWYNLQIPTHQAGLWRGESAITMCTVAHTRSCLTRYGYWDETLLRSGDIVMWHSIVAGGHFKNLTFLAEPTALHFVANWRNTAQHRARSRLTSFLFQHAFRGVLADALSLPVRAGETQQESAWNHLTSDPRAIPEIRAAVVQFQDALLWPVRTPVGLIALRTGLLLAGMLDSGFRGAMWMSSARRRGLFRRLRQRTASLQKASGPESRIPNPESRAPNPESRAS